MIYLELGYILNMFCEEHHGSGNMWRGGCSHGGGQEVETRGQGQGTREPQHQQWPTSFRQAAPSKGPTAFPAAGVLPSEDQYKPLERCFIPTYKALLGARGLLSNLLNLCAWGCTHCFPPGFPTSLISQQRVVLSHILEGSPSTE